MDTLVKTSAAKTLGDEFSRVKLSSQGGNGDLERESVSTWNKKRGSSTSMTRPKESATKATNNVKSEEELWRDGFEVPTTTRNVRRRSSSTISTKSAAPKTSVYRGVSYNRKNRKWKAVITYHGKQHFLGYFLSEMSAAKAYDKASHKRRGPTASLNFPSEISTEEEEAPNLHKTSRYRGVSFCKSNKKWKAVITYKGKQTYLGYFTSEIDAAKCYDRAARKNRGRNALTNFESAPSDADEGAGKLKMEIEVKTTSKRKQKQAKKSVVKAVDQSMRGVLGVYDMEEKSSEGQEERKMDLDDTRIGFDTIGFTDTSRDFAKDTGSRASPNALSSDMSFHAPYDHSDTDFLKIKDSFIKKLPGFDEEVKEEDKQFLSYLSKNEGDDGVYSPYEMHELDSYLEFGL